MEEKNETFNYTYSAKQQEEIKNIRKKYAAPEEDKMEQLRKLDRQVTQKAQAWAIALGVVGALILGTGNEIWKKCRKDIRNLGHKKIQEDIYGISLINNRYRK